MANSKMNDTQELSFKYLCITSLIAFVSRAIGINRMFPRNKSLQMHNKNIGMLCKVIFSTKQERALLLQPMGQLVPWIQTGKASRASIQWIYD